MAEDTDAGEAPPEETVADVLQGEPKDPDSPNHGASFASATDGTASRELPKKKQSESPDKAEPQPDESKPQESVKESESKAKPSEDDKAKPSEDDKAKPSEDDKAKPSEDDKAKPSEDDKAKPSEDDKAKPSEDDKAKPSEDDKAKPSEDDKAKPSEDDKAKPSEDDKAKPSEDDKAKPSEDDKAKPKDGDAETKPKATDQSEDKDKTNPDHTDESKSETKQRPDRDNIDAAEGAKSHMVMSPADKDGDGKEDEGKKLAIFDFDGTLIEQDCLTLFICKLVGGKLQAYLRFLPAIVTAFVEAVFTTDDYMDYKSALKAHWMINALKGYSVEQINAVAATIKNELDWRDKLVADLKRFGEADDTDVVIATGAMDLFIKPLIDDLPINALICSHFEVKDNRLTGRMAGKEKHTVNVVRGEKRFRTQAYIKEHGPYAHVIGYGNMPDDGPMLSLCDEFYIV